MNNALLLIDIQKEYTTPGRDFYLQGIDESLAHCRQLLAHARLNAWDIIHIQHSNAGKEGVTRFMPDTEYFDFANGFEPLLGELHFVKTDFSCYSSPEFEQFMNTDGQAQRIHMIGYNSVMCCLSTLEVARDRKHKMFFIADASLAKSMPGNDEASTHEFMVNVYKAKKLAEIIYTKDVLAPAT
ncbi:MAG: isochorismatase family protein [Gammaproteobacteria bacterium]